MGNYIPAVTIENVSKMSFKKMLLLLEPYTQDHIPEGIHGDSDAYKEIERLIGRLANIYAYMIHLYAYAANQASMAKLLGEDTQYQQLMRKRDALYELARAVRYKHEACSRMLTAALGYEEAKVFESADGKGREDKAKGRKMPGWETDI